MLVRKLIFAILIICTSILFGNQFSIDNGVSSKKIFLENNITTTVTESGYLKIKAEKYDVISEPGFPEMPTYSTLYLVDPNKDYNFTLQVNESYIIEDIELNPFQPSRKNDELYKNQDFYSGSQEYPQESLLISERIRARNMELIQISVTPFSYNPQSRTLEVFTNIEIDVIEQESNIQRNAVNMKRSRLFEDLYGDMIVNFERSSRDEDYQIPAILYICGGDSCENSYVQSLFNWRHEQGYIVYTATEQEVGGNSASTSEIKNYIENAVENWNNPPEMIGLIGDTGGSYGLPCYNHEWGGGWYGYNGATDFDYTQLNGNDLLSDVLIGRISASSSSDLANIINKTIQYEKALYQSDSWFEGAALVGDPSSSGVSTIITNQYIENIMENFGFEDIDTNYGDGNYDDWVEDRFDEGILYYNYRGFYGASGIGTSGFSNGFETPFVTSLTCGTGDFDGTSDSESFVRTGSVSNPSGAVAAIGVATTGTHTAYNNIVNMGIYDGIFSKELDHASAAMTSGHLALYNTYPSDPGEATETFISWSNLIGDPALHLWTDTPKNFTVSYPTSITQGTTSLDIYIDDDSGYPVENAIVTILKGNDILFESKLTDSQGYVNFNWDATNNSESIKITIRKRNYRPFQRNINISSSSNLSVNTNSISIDGNGVANPGETIELTIPVTNSDNSSINNVSATLTSNSEYVTIFDGTSSYGNINSNQTANGEAYTLLISNDAVNLEDLQLNLSISAEGTNTNCVVPVLIQGPLVEVLSSNVNVGSGVINVTIANNGSSAVQNLNLNLSSLSDMITINSSESINNLSAGQSENISFNFSETDYFVPGTTLSLPIQITSTNGYNRQEFVNATFGNVSVSDPLGPDEYGYYIYDSGDTGYDLSPEYEWIEIAEGLGNNLNLDDDGDGNGSERTTIINLPFSFTFYGQTYGEITVSADGWISFGRNEIPSFRNYSIPGAGGPSPMIAAFWDDLKTGSGGDVYSYITDDYVVIQWDYMRTYNNNDRETFEIILYNNEENPTLTGDNEIKIQYYDFNNTSNGYYPVAGTPTHGCYSTIGIENHLGNQGLQYTFNNQYSSAAMPLSDGDALFITTGRAYYDAGDLNQDGSINVLDVVTLVNIVLNVIEPSPIQEIASDINEDGLLNVLDVVLIVNIALGN